MIHATELEYFADHLKRLRLRFVGKQLRFSSALGCTEAAVSFWESGKRVPQKRMLPRILETLTRCGAPPRDLSDLLVRWQVAKERSLAHRNSCRAAHLAFTQARAPMHGTARAASDGSR
jgi:transcriptional regulator with XRE-family HTH domain